MVIAINLLSLIRLPGLHYNRNRYYDPLQGRYITQDPIGLKGEWNLYQYPLNPIQILDPLGLKTLILVGGSTKGNPFGHAALAFSGHGVYSYGTKTKFGSKVTDYLASQLSYRDTTLGHDANLVVVVDCQIPADDLIVHFF
ncbi:RHS repeat-associated core domain-containing protein [Salmonella enterica]|nr:RHS repeat-associated core domain-containing protein [Salmonella enterica]